jgi:acyl carrier protein
MSDRSRVIRRIAELLGVEPGSIAVDAPLFSLVNSSFRLVELVIELQEEYDVRFHQEDMNRVATVGELIDLVITRQYSRGPD